MLNTSHATAPRRPLGLRRGHPDQPVRGLQPLRGGGRTSRRFHPQAQCAQSGRQCLGKNGTKRGVPRRSSSRCSKRKRGARAQARRLAGAEGDKRRHSAADGRGAAPLQGGVQCRLHHQQHEARRRPGHGAQPGQGRRRRRGDDAVRACDRIEQARLPQARPAHLPPRLRADRRAARALRLSRRSRHQPEAGRARWACAPSRWAIPTQRSPSWKRWSGFR